MEFLIWPLAAAFLVSAAVSLAAGVPVHGLRPGLLVADAFQGVCGAALALMVYLLTGPVRHGAAEIMLVGLVGTWVSIGVAHMAASVLRKISAHEP